MIGSGTGFHWGTRTVGSILVAVLALGAGCATNPDGTTEYKRTAIGALAGAAVGAGGGALIAGRGHRGTGALIGGVVGAAGGGAVGNYMDRQGGGGEGSWHGGRGGSGGRRRRRKLHGQAGGGDEAESPRSRRRPRGRQALRRSPLGHPVLLRQNR